ncbi:MAG TPA: hypothetical protein VF720_03775 [Candidatus Eisenbacteria bacterium]
MRHRATQLIGAKQLAIAAALVVANVLSACGGDDPPPPVTVEPTLASIQAEIFTPTCATASCHSTGQLEAGLDLSAGKSYDSLINADCTTEEADREGLWRVKPGDPSKSFLIEKLRGVPNSKGRRMPYDGPYLSDAEIDVIEQWIAEGANP